jgi:Restriction endonuclease fold toxin 7
VNGSTGSSDRRYTDKPTTLTASGQLDITVGNQTSVIGALINSDANKLALTTGTLVVGDLMDRDYASRTGGGVTLGFGSGSPIKNVSFDVSRKENDGITRATIGLGAITIKNVSAADAQAIIAKVNREPAKLQEILRHYEFAAGGELDVDAFLKLPANLQALARALTALSTPIPDHVAAMGPRAEQIFQRMLYNGVSLEQAMAQAQTEQFARTVRMYGEVDKMIAAYGSIADVPPEVLRALAEGETLLYFNEGGAVVPYIAMNCDIASTLAQCRALLKNMPKGKPTLKSIRELMQCAYDLPPADLATFIKEVNTALGTNYLPGKAGSGVAADGAIKGPNGGLYYDVGMKDKNGNQLYYDAPSGLFFTPKLDANGVLKFDPVGRSEGGEYFEKLVLASWDVPSNKVSYATKVGGLPVTVIPDAVGGRAGVLEAKFYNATTLDLSDQLRGELDLAKKQKVPLNFLVEPHTTISNALTQQIRNNVPPGIIWVYSPISGTSTRRP